MAVFPARVRALELDKQAHAYACFGLSLASADLVESRGGRYPELKGLGLALGVGFLKELTDPRFEGGDLLADTLGAVTAALFHYSVRF